MTNNNNLSATERAEIVKTVREWFKQNDLSMQKIGEMIGVSQQIISYNFYRERGFRQQFIDKLVEQFGFNRSFLQTGKGYLIMPEEESEDVQKAIRVFSDCNPKAETFDPETKTFPDGLGSINESFVSSELFESLYANYQTLKKDIELTKMLLAEEQKCVQALDLIFKTLKSEH